MKFVLYFSNIRLQNIYILHTLTYRLLNVEKKTYYTEMANFFLHDKYKTKYIYIWVFLSIQQAGRTLRQGKSRCFNYTFSCYSIYMLFVNLSSNFFKIQMNYMIWKAIYIIQCNIVDNQIIFLSFVHLNKYIRCLIIISDIRYTPVTCLYWCYSNCKSILM